MCGIAGIIGLSPDRDKLMDQMLLSQHHRGPDFTGKEDMLEHGILGHNRLSIIDLHEAANQPFHSLDERYIIVYNGEVYNYLELRTELQSIYTFRTESDTEVLLTAYQHWGKDCLDRFNGMFSFAIWDKQKKTLFAARDRFGVKPLHYAIFQEVFYFSSEIKALWAASIPKVPCEQVWAGYLAYGTYGLPNETFWEGIQQLPAGHYLEWKNNSTHITQWYDFVGRVKSLPILTEQEVKEQWTALALDSIRLRFRSDVPVGFNISGGLDSSLLLALVHQLYPGNDQIEAFTFYTGDERYDELPWVEDMMHLTEFPLNPVKLSAEEVPELAEQISYFEDEPYGGIPTIAYSKLFQTARNKGIIVLLDGQGMDEAWAGYDYYLNKSGNLVQGTGSSPVRPECLNPVFREKAIKPAFPQPFDNDLQNLQYRDLFYTKIPRALRFNDRISMMHSTELREPFLDHRMVELAFSLPEKMKINNGKQKWLVRIIANEFLSTKVALAPKRVVQTPQREWLGGSLRSWVLENLQSYSKSEILNHDTVLEQWGKYLTSEKANSFFIWQWLNTGMLRLKNTKDSIPSILTKLKVN